MAKSAFGGGVLTSLRASFGEDTGAPLKLRLDQIEEDPDQPRQNFDEGELAQLAASIRLMGVLQPIAVRPLSGSQYRLVYGARRLRAARLAERSHIPAYLLEDGQAGLPAQVIENQHRAALSNSDLATAIARLSALGMKVKEIAVVTGLPEWRLRHYRAVPSLAPFLSARLDAADMRALYELQGAWEKAEAPARAEIEAAVGQVAVDEMLTVTEARRIIASVTGRKQHSIVLDQVTNPAASKSVPPPKVVEAEQPAARRSPGRTAYIVEVSGRRGRLVTNRVAKHHGHAIVAFEEGAEEWPVSKLRLVAAETET